MAVVRLVAYTGAQPAGFTVSTVPASWNIVSSDDFSCGLVMLSWVNGSVHVVWCGEAEGTSLAGAPGHP